MRNWQIAKRAFKYMKKNNIKWELGEPPINEHDSYGSYAPTFKLVKLKISKKLTPIALAAILHEVHHIKQDKKKILLPESFTGINRLRLERNASLAALRQLRNWGIKYNNAELFLKTCLKNYIIGLQLTNKVSINDQNMFVLLKFSKKRAIK